MPRTSAAAAAAGLVLLLVVTTASAVADHTPTAVRRQQQPVQPVQSGQSLRPMADGSAHAAAAAAAAPPQGAPPAEQRFPSAAQRVDSSGEADGHLITRLSVAAPGGFSSFIVLIFGVSAGFVCGGGTALFFVMKNPTMFIKAGKK